MTQRVTYRFEMVGIDHEARHRGVSSNQRNQGRCTFYALQRATGVLPQLALRPPSTGKRLLAQHDKEGRGRTLVAYRHERSRRRTDVYLGRAMIPKPLRPTI
jgi:hypothetical protein